MKTSSSDKDVIVGLIESAFKDVTLGEGIGLWEGQAHDDYAGEAVAKKYRSRDEKNDWRRILPENLNRCHSSLSFFDPKGMRFHLPAYIVSHLKDPANMDPIFTLTHLNDYVKGQLSELDTEQRKAIVVYLQHLLDDEDFLYYRPMIERSLNEYWMQAYPEIKQDKKCNKIRSQSHRQR